MIKKYREYICNEVCDSVVVSILHYCLRGGYDIESEVPMTDKLYYEITSQFISQMLLMNPSARPFELRIETVCTDWNPSAVATAMSCGIDSLTTYYEYTEETVPEGLRLTYLTFFEQGAHHGGGGLPWEEQHRIYLAQLEKVRSFCDLIHCELIDVQSNLAEFLRRLFWSESYDHTHTYRNMAIVMLLQKLIRVYYYAATYNLDQFGCSIDSDSAHYDKWLLPTLSTSSTSFFSANSSMTRIEKIKYLSQKPETYDHILVCYKEGYNCGICIKCWRTMLEMEVSGVLDLYRGSFDVDCFRSNYEYYLTKMLRMRKTEPIMQEIFDYMVEHEIDIPNRCQREAQKTELRLKLRKRRWYQVLGRIKSFLQG